MTAQFRESLRYLGEDVSMCAEPLGDYFLLGGPSPAFDADCSALWRGYLGSWEIVDNRLYLIGLSGRLVDGTEATLATVFPDFPNRVFAHWYSGTIRVPQGKQLKYVHAGYGSIYEQDVLLDLDHGVVVGTRLKHNAPNASVGDNSERNSGEIGDRDRGQS